MADDVAADVERGSHPFRSLLAVVLVVVGCLLAPLAIIGMTLRDEILDTGRFVALVGRLEEDPAIQGTIVAELAPKVVALADRVAPGIIGVEDVEQTLARLFESDEFRSIWETVVRAAHPQIRQVLLGRDTDILQTDGGRVVVDLIAIGREVQERLVAAGFEPAASIDLGDTDLTVPLYESRRLADVQEDSDLLVRLAPIVAIVGAAAFALALIVAPRRGRVLWWSGLGLLAGSIVVGGLLALGRLRYLDALSSRVPEAAAESAYEIIAHPFVVRVRWWFLVALVILVVGAFASPGRFSRSASERWLSRHRLDLAGLVAAVALGVAVWWHHPTLPVMIVVATAAVAGVLIVALIGRDRGAEEQPGI